MKRQNINLEDADRLRKKSEELLNRRNKAHFGSAAATETDMVKLIHELEVHQIELEMQNEELVIAKEKAELAEEKYTELYDFAQSGYLTISNDNTIFELNFVAARILGKERSQLIKKRFDVFLSGNSKPVFNNFLNEVLNSKSEATCEVSLSTDDNFSIQVQIKGIFSQNSRQYLLTIFDLTEHKRLEDTLRESQLRLATILESIADTFYSLDNKWRFTEVNQAAERAPFGRPAKQLLGKVIWNLYPDLLGSKIHQHYLDAAAQLKSEHYILQSPLNGRWYEVFMQGHQKGVDVYMRDVTERKQFEEDLKLSEERFKAMAEVSPVGMCVTEIANGKFLYINPAYEEQFKFNKQELLNKKAKDIYFDINERKIILKKLKEDGFVANYEIRLKKKDNILFWALSSISHITYMNKPALLGTFIDISKRKIAEDALYKSEKEWKETFDKIPDLIAIIDKDHKLVRANKAMLEKLGVPLEGTSGLLCHECVHGTLKPPSNCPHAMMLTDNKEHVSEIFEVNLGGDFLISATPIFDENDMLTGSVHVAHDITERKKSEKKLKEAQEKLNIALENGNIGVWEWNIKTNVVLWDERMEKMFGLAPGTFGKTYQDFVDLINEEDLPHFQKAINDAHEKNGSFETIIRTKNVEGKVKFISPKALLNRDEEGIPISFTGVCFDVTALKEGTEQLITKLNEELLRSNKELQNFAYVASHDLQEPLRMVSSFTQLLSQRYKDQLDKNAHEYINYAVEGANRMYDLINGLLAYSKIQTKGKSYKKVNMQDVLYQVNKNLSIAIAEKNAIVTSDELPSVFADEAQMIQLMQNLLGNAIKFSETNKHVHIAVVSETDKYIFSVKDEGLGIDNQYFDRIFQIFQRLLPKDEYEGTGLGLAICKRIVESHNGNIWIESELGKGSTFYFCLPKG